MDNIQRYLTFMLNKNLFALPLAVIERIILMVELTSLPNAPEIIMGVFNLHGRIIPVVDLRQRFKYEKKSIDTEDYIIIGRTSCRTIGLRVDNVGDIISGKKNDVVEKDNILPGISYIEGVVKLNNNIILIHDLERCLSLEEHEQVSKAIENLDGADKFSG